MEPVIAFEAPIHPLAPQHQHEPLKEVVTYGSRDVLAVTLRADMLPHHRSARSFIQFGYRAVNDHPPRRNSVRAERENRPPPPHNHDHAETRLDPRPRFGGRFLAHAWIVEAPGRAHWPRCARWRGRKSLFRGRRRGGTALRRENPSRSARRERLPGTRASWLRLGCVWCYVLPRSAHERCATLRRYSMVLGSNSFVLAQELHLWRE